MPTLPPPVGQQTITRLETMAAKIYALFMLTAKDVPRIQIEISRPTVSPDSTTTLINLKTRRLQDSHGA